MTLRQVLLGLVSGGLLFGAISSAEAGSIQTVLARQWDAYNFFYATVFATGTNPLADVQLFVTHNGQITPIVATVHKFAVQGGTAWTFQGFERPVSPGDELTAVLTDPAGDDERGVLCVAVIGGSRCQ